MNQKLINDLREGRIVLHNEPKNPEAVKAILKEAFPTLKFGEDFFKRETYALGGTDGLPKIPIADFLRPDPKFNVGQIIHSFDSDNRGDYKILSMEYDDDVQLWFYKLDGAHLMIAEIELGTITESATKTGNEQQFIIGQQYEFSVCNDWIKGTLLGIVDNQYKYIALVGTNKVPLAFDFIRPIQPVKITRWINICPDGRVLRKSYETEQEARDKACQGGMHDCKQVKLEGLC